MKMKKTTLCTTLSFLMTGNVIAATLPPAEDTMTVWGSPVANTSTVVTPETFTQLDKRNVAEALTIVPGVTLQKSGGRNELQVRVRGFDNRQVPVFYDGVPIYIPYDGNLDLGRFLTSNLASLEVSKGYTSLLQGPNQMGGSINLTTSKPSKPLEASIGYRQGWSRGSDNAFDADASLGIKNDIGYLQVSGSQLKQRFAGLPHSVNNDVAGENGRRTNSASDDKRGIVKVGFTPRENDEYTFTYIKQDGEKQNPPYAGTSDQKPRYWQWPEYDKESYYYQGTTRLGDGFTLKSRAYRDTFKNTLMMYNSLSDLHKGIGSYSHYDDYTDGAALQLSADMRERDQLSFAAHWKEDVHREQGSKDAPYDRYKDRTWSLSSEYQWAVDDQWDVVAGISYDWRDSLEAMKHENNGKITRYDDNSQNAFNWQAMTKYHFDNRDEIALSFSDRSRFPTLKERYTTSRPAFGQVALVNPNLKAERARSVDLTYNGYLTENWGYEASVYYNRISDAILTQNIDTNTVQNRNSGRVDYTGLDLGIKGVIAEELKVGLNYSLIHSSVKDQGVGKITGLPTQTVVGWLTYTPWQPLSVTLSEEARSSSYSNTDGSQKAAGFAVTNLRTDYQIIKGLSVNASVNNLFDTAYAYTEGFAEEGRNYWAGIEYQF
ncbi:MULTISPECIES: TonB-dependent siderophore receptor [unclassified Serratia (in: enterobacteria)]|uniref:TonB-dependent receptor plug domain-containing protein n=1 Tax=unclassified Serratia (in: enterobacteria) TaxID=2647522 RepID=UPI00046AF41A|nr:MULTISPECIES: TonB-dependent receptor [unclassified Serratia (in: enterobacteria)]